jgi:hypothetical protein
MSETTPQDTAGALISAGNLCWTPPARAALVTRGTPVPAGETTLGEFLLIPSAARPRLLVPAGHPAAAAESVRRFSHSLGWRERLLRAALTGVLRTGAPDLLVPARMRITAPGASADQVRSLQDHLGGLLGEPVVLSLGVGTARANRKPVLEAISRSGRPLAFVKLADHDLTRQLLASEASALTRLAANPPAGLDVPRLLHLGSWNGTGVLVQSALRTPPWLTHRRSSVPFAAMRALSEAFGTGRRPACDSPSWQRILTDGETITDAARATLFAKTAAAIGALLERCELRHGAWHGDWAPWNMAWVRGTVHGTVRDTVRIWDWERFAEGVPAGFDPLHYVLAQHAIQLPWTGALDATRAQAAAITRWSGVAPSEADLVFLWYLLELCRRYLLSAAPATGVSLRPRADSLLGYLYSAVHPGTGNPALPDWSTHEPA